MQNRSRGLAGLVVGLALLSTATTAQESGSASGKVTAPDSTSIADMSSVSGTISGLYRHLWLVARVGDLNWPLAQAKAADGKWTSARAVVVLGLPEKTSYELSLLDVPLAAHEIIADWMENSDRAGRYLPMLSRNMGPDVRVVASSAYQTE